MTKDAKNWVQLFGGFEDRHDDACSAAFFGMYPAELEIELVESAILIEADALPAFAENIHRHAMSPLFNGEPFWRVFKSLRPNCPLNPIPFCSLSEAFWERNELLFRDCWKQVRSEIFVLGVWIEATGEYENRAPKEIEDGDAGSQSASAEDVAEAFEQIRSEGGKPTKSEIGRRIRAKGKTIGSNRLQSFKVAYERERQSADSPPD